MMLVTLVLAMGKYTPLFPLLFEYAPGFNLFRGMDKFIWLTALFLSMLAGIGLDQVLRDSERPWWLIGGRLCPELRFAVCRFGRRSGMVGQGDEQVRPWEAPYMIRPRSITLLITCHRPAPGCVRDVIEGAACLFCAGGILTLAKSRRRIACVGMVLMAD